jgi:hypothetical protein
MEPLNEVITLDFEESNELAFRLKVEGAESPAKVRLVCENGDMSYMFAGRGTSEEGVVQFIVPQMKNKLQEGTYPARVEVLIDNRYFVPVEFQMQFKKTMQVFAESVKVSHASVKPDIRVSAAPVVVRTSKQATSAPVVPQPKPVLIDESRSAPVVPKPKQDQSTLKEKFSKQNNQQQNTADINKLLQHLLKMTKD